MKLKIEKLQTGRVRVEVVTDPGKKPLSVELTREQVELFISLLQTASGTDSFFFQMDL